MTESSLRTVIIIGAGQAGGQCAASLRRMGWPGRIVLVGAEPHPPYQRPPLSKAYLSGEMDEPRLWLQPPETWAEQDVELRLGTEVTKIDRTQQLATFSDGQTEQYDYLVLATGSRVRPLPVPGADLRGVRYLRTIADVDQLRTDFAPEKRVAIIGGGYIGLEAAAVARRLGATPIIVEAMDRLLARVAVPELSTYYQAAHEARGVACHTSAMVDGLTGKDGAVASVRFVDGRQIACDSVLIGIGVMPNQEIAESSGLDVDNGITVDHACRTTDPRVFAIGDCCEQFNWLYERRMRLESVPNALEQAKHAAAEICGQPPPRPEVPWFWSDQYDLKLQSAGVSGGADKTVARGEQTDDRFALFHFQDGVLIATDAINDPPSFMAAKMMIAARSRPDPLAIANPDIPLKTIMKAALAAK
jgi:3-phenylpropionate/trans-cinnamate dioxygenase ferredoxin reductase subunit